MVETQRKCPQCGEQIPSDAPNGICPRCILDVGLGEGSFGMTAPVSEQITEDGEQIAMTAPVTEQIQGELREISFVVPSSYTLDTLPEPNDERIYFEEVPARTVATLSFGWFARNERITRKKQELVELVEGMDMWTAVGEPIFAAYNDPFSFPPLRRYEVSLELVE